MKFLRFVFYDQLSLSLASLQDINKQDVVVFLEVMEEASYIEHHPKKLALWFASMRHFAEEIRNKGIEVYYVKLDDPENTGAFSSELERCIKFINPEKIIFTAPSEYRHKKMIDNLVSKINLPIEILNDNRYLCSINEFKNWAGNKKQLRMEFFYRFMRAKYNILMENETSPVGGKWNFDHDNRKPFTNELRQIKRISHKKSTILTEVLLLIKEKFSKNFGDLEPFYYAINREQALIELNHFIEVILPLFGDHQDVMMKNQAYLYHSLLSSYINIGFLLPLEIIKKAENAYYSGKAPINAVEGFIRQIMGWREYVRGIYWLKMPNYLENNYFQAYNDLPAFYWGGKTHMACISEVVKQTRIHAYSHHIQRLMVTGNFALLAGLDVKQVHDWYLAVYSDAYEWVELPNTLGMSLFADGGLLASKPYAASGKYIDKMSNFCSDCFYSVKENTGEGACPFNALYWHFLYRNRSKLSNNPRLALIYKAWDGFDEAKRIALIDKAEDSLEKLKRGLL